MTSFYYPALPSDRERLAAAVRSTRRRWRLRQLLRGFALLLFGTAGLALLAGLVIDASRFDPTTLTVSRLVVYLSLVALLVFALLRPLWRQPSDHQIALYLEEHEPSLGGRLIAALELGEQEKDGASSALVEKLVESAAEACRDVDDGKRVERAGLWRASGLAAGSTACSLALFLIGPAFLQNTTPLLLDPRQEPSRLNPYAIYVEPGDVTMARGADLEISARLEGFEAAEADLAVRVGEGDWSRSSMVRDETGYSLMLLDLQEASEYFVEASGVRSPVHRVEVADLPYVEKIQLTLEFPPYTGLDPVEQPDSGDIVALAGTRARLAITPTFAVTGGFIEFAESNERLPLAVQANGQLQGSLEVGEPGRYRILLDGPGGEPGVASPDYLIDPVIDQPPILKIASPGRDIRVTNLEEITIAIEAQDDIGVQSVELAWSLAGHDERSASLYANRPGRRSFAGSQTLYLEEITRPDGGLLRPGDLVSYWARAQDGSGDGETVSDIYFLEIRAFDRNYRQADSAGGGGQPGMSGDQLTAQQRMIIAATFKLARQRSGRGLDDDLATVTLSQGRLREEVSGLVEQLTERGVMPGGNTPVALMAELLPGAVEAMSEAEQALGEGRPGDALAPEQQALQALQRVEAAFQDVQVTQSEGGAGGGQISDELSDLFEMELDRLANTYEEVQRGERKTADSALDETLEKLRELARRQQQENERMRARARRSDSGTQTGTSGRAQRELAEEAEEVARKLERLARQESLPDLAETAQRLRQAAEEMRRAAASDAAGEALGSSALDQLNEARRQLESDRSGRLQRDTRRAIERTQRLRQQQQRMVDRVAGLDPEEPSQADTLQQTMAAKERMGGEVGDLEAELDQLARGARRDQPRAAQRLEEAAAEIRDNKIREKILYSRGVAQQRSRDYARNFEEHIDEALGELEARLREAASAIGTSREERLRRALEETREAVTALESVGERLRGRAEGRAGGNPEGAAPSTPASAQEQRQISRELRRRHEQLEDLGERLQQEGVAIADLEALTDRLAELGSPQLAAPDVLAVLEGEIVRGLKELEYSLRRSLGASDDPRQVQLSDDDVPDEYRALVERYYEALAGNEAGDTSP